MEELNSLIMEGKKEVEQTLENQTKIDSYVEKLEQTAKELNTPIANEEYLEKRRQLLEEQNKIYNSRRKIELGEIQERKLSLGTKSRVNDVHNNLTTKVQKIGTSLGMINKSARDKIVASNIDDIELNKEVTEVVNELTSVESVENINNNIILSMEENNENKEKGVARTRKTNGSIFTSILVLVTTITIGIAFATIILK